MSLFNIISIFMVVLIGIALVVIELKSYRYKRQQLLDSKAKVLADIDAYEQKKETVFTNWRPSGARNVSAS